MGTTSQPEGTVGQSQPLVRRGEVVNKGDYYSIQGRVR